MKYFKSDLTLLDKEDNNYSTDLMFLFNQDDLIAFRTKNGVDQLLPGLTGWAQVNGLRGDTSIEDRTRYDLWYVENWSLWLDFKIIIRTVFKVLSGTAY